MSLATLWIISPVFLDVPSFLRLRQEILAALQRKLGSPFRAIRFVAVDDTAGFDPEVGALRKLDDVLIVEPPFSLGHQRALVYALRSTVPCMAEDDFIVTLDADGEDRPEDLPRLLAPLLADVCDTRKVVLALRTQRRESWSFKVLYLFFKLFFRCLTGVAVRSGNYATYRGWFARRFLLHPHFDLCYSSTFMSLNLALEFVPCARGSRYAGRSRMSYPKLVLHGIRMLMPFIDRIAIRALLVFSGILVLGIVGSVVVVGVRLFTSASIPGWATSTLLLVLLLSFVALGNFVVLFVVFSESRGISLNNIEEPAGGNARAAPAPPI